MTGQEAARSDETEATETDALRDDLAVLIGRSRMKPYADGNGGWLFRDATPIEVADEVMAWAAALVELDAAMDEPCDAEIHSWDRYQPEQIDSYWIRCTRVGPHDEHEDSNTRLTWKESSDG